MKKYYKIPVTDVIASKFQYHLLEGSDPDEEGQIGGGLGNENKTFEENDIVKDVTTPTTLWDE